MVIGFTGHRDKLADELQLAILHISFPLAIWVHGGATGFDSQVDKCARELYRESIIIKPDYEFLPGKVAPLARNRIIVQISDLIIACYDGRIKGGTYYTINYAKKLGKPVRIWQPKGG